MGTHESKTLRLYRMGVAREAKVSQGLFGQETKEIWGSLGMYQAWSLGGEVGLCYALRRREY